MKRFNRDVRKLLVIFSFVLVSLLVACQPTNTTTSNNADTPATDAPAAEAPTEAANTASDTQAQPDTSASDTATPKLNLNEASGDDFRTVPNVGDRMVREFLEYRPYISIQQFRREMGKYIDDAQITEYEQYVFVPIDVDESDAATLQQIPEVDEAMAETLIAARPYGSNEAFLTELGAHISEDALAIATTYLIVK